MLFIEYPQYTKQIFKNVSLAVSYYRYRMIDVALASKLHRVPSEFQAIFITDDKFHVYLKPFTRFTRDFLENLPLLTRFRL